MPRHLSLLIALALLAFAPAAGASTRIVGGHSTSDGDFPWQVALVTAGAPTAAAGFVCGGTLVAPTLVLTASHCTAGESASDLQVIANRRNLSDDASGSVVAVAGISTDPDSDLTGSYPRNDLSLLVLDTPVPSATPLPIAGAEGSADDALYAPGTTLTVAGWGMLHDPDQVATYVPDSLQSATVTRTSDGDCTDVYGTAFHAADMICAGDGTPSPCYGDSGGGLVAPTTASPDRTDPADWKLVGVVSWGQGCGTAGFPGVYARVTAPAMHAYATQPDPPVAPAIVTLPTVTGLTQIGQTLTCTPATFSGSVTATQNAWVHVFDFGGQIVIMPIDGATATTYVPTAVDVGNEIACETTASGLGGKTVADSTAVGPVTDPNAPPPGNPLADAQAALASANAALAKAQADNARLVAQGKADADKYAKAAAKLKQARADLRKAKQQVAKLKKAGKKKSAKKSAKKAAKRAKRVTKIKTSARAGRHSRNLG